ncbi:MAG: hypothetical protein GY714_15775 [Desulfobacterales bacterium]|nr:hypothetical protein [Desulfobacterales bacterium]
MNRSILVTLGPSSFNKNKVEQMTKQNVALFRINLSHTPIEEVEKKIKQIQSWTNVPICLDSEGAQIRNQNMIDEEVSYTKGDRVKIHFEEVIGDQHNISFTPNHVAKLFQTGDIINVDFNSVCFSVESLNKDYCIACVKRGGHVGSNKAADLNRSVPLNPITEKDKAAIEIGRSLGIINFALSFTNNKENVLEMRKLTGKKSCIISKIESYSGLLNLNEIIQEADQILIDRGDLSRQVPIVKIPFLQRRIISQVRSHGKPVFVATNLLESMIGTPTPTRAELNDVVSTLSMGASGLVLAAETAIGKFPVDSVKIIRELINQFEKWTSNTSIDELLEDCPFS